MTSETNYQVLIRRVTKHVGLGIKVAVMQGVDDT